MQLILRLYHRPAPVHRYIAYRPGQLGDPLRHLYHRPAPVHRYILRGLVSGGIRCGTYTTGLPLFTDTSCGAWSAGGSAAAPIPPACPCSQIHPAGPGQLGDPLRHLYHRPAPVHRYIAYRPGQLGDPLRHLYHRPASVHRYILRGLVSWGIRCGTYTTDLPLFTDTSCGAWSAGGSAAAPIPPACPCSQIHPAGPGQLGDPLTIPPACPCSQIHPAGPGQLGDPLRHLYHRPAPVHRYIAYRPGQLGDPLRHLYHRPAPVHRYILRGLVSWGIRCGTYTTGLPLFTDTSCGAWSAGGSAAAPIPPTCPCSQIHPAGPGQLGDPLRHLYHRPASVHRYILRGLVSWGIRCGTYTTDLPLFTDTSCGAWSAGGSAAAPIPPACPCSQIHPAGPGQLGDPLTIPPACPCSQIHPAGPGQLGDPLRHRRRSGGVR